MLRQRIITAVIAVALILLALFVFPQSLTLGVLAAIILAGGWEWTAFIRARSRMARIVYLLVLTAGIVSIWWAVPEHLPLVPILFFSLALWAVATIMVIRYPMPIDPWLTWLGGLAVLIPSFLALGRLYVAEPRGPQMLLFVLVVIWSADIGAYFTGRRFGRVKLAPKVSPGKTWEGVMGGMVAVILVSLAGAWWFAISPAILVPLSLAAASLSVIGDLTVSLFKRSAGVKDSGHLFPGHGGVLDRVDSLAASSPLFLLMFTLLGLK